MRLLAMAGLAVMVMGCGTVPKTAVNSRNLDGEKVIYLEQSDRIPKDALNQSRLMREQIRFQLSVFKHCRLK